MQPKERDMSYMPWLSELQQILKQEEIKKEEQDWFYYQENQDKRFSELCAEKEEENDK